MSNVFSLYIAAFIVVFCSNRSLADTGSSSAQADLLGVFEAAIQNDAQLSAARHAYRAQVEAVPQSRAGLLPEINAGVVSDSSRLRRDEPALSRERSATTFRANLTQPLFRPDRWYQLKAAQAVATQAEMDLSFKEQAMVLNAARLYFETLRQLDESAAARAEEAAMRYQRDQAQGRLEGGVSSVTDVYDAQAGYDNARANRQSAQRKVEDAFEALNRLTKQSYNSIAGLMHQMPIEAPVPNDADPWVAAATRQNLELQASDYAVEAARHTLSKQKAGYSPTVDVVVSYRKGDNDSFGYSNPSDYGTNGYRGAIEESTIGLELNIPLYSGGKTRSQVAESTERLYQAQDEREDRLREIVFNTRTAFRGVNTDIIQIKARRQSIFSNQKSVEANQAGLDLGSRNIADVLNSQRLLYAAVKDYNNARYDYILNNLKLKQVSGILAPSDLNYLSLFLKRDYDPDIDFLPLTSASPESRSSVVQPEERISIASRSQRR
jgi:outer membrane protein